MHHHVFASPLVEVARDARQSALRVAQRHLRCYERLAFLQVIFRIVRVDASEKVVVFRIVGINLQLKIAAIAEGSTNHVSLVLLSLAVQRQHHLSLVSMRVARAVLVLNHLLARQYGLLDKTSLVSPRAIEMRHPHVAATDRQTDRGKLRQGDGFRLAVLYLRPRLNHVLVGIGLVAQHNSGRIDGVFHRDTDLVALLVTGSNVDGCRHVAIGMFHRQCSLCRRVQSIDGIGIHASVDRCLQVL